MGSKKIDSGMNPPTPKFSDHSHEYKTIESDSAIRAKNYFANSTKQRHSLNVPRSTKNVQEGTCLLTLPIVDANNYKKVDKDFLSQVSKDRSGSRTKK